MHPSDNVQAMRHSNSWIDTELTSPSWPKDESEASKWSAEDEKRRADAALTRARRLSTEKPNKREASPSATRRPVLQFMPKAHRQDNKARVASLRASANHDAEDDQEEDSDEYHSAAEADMELVQLSPASSPPIGAQSPPVLRRSAEPEAERKPMHTLFVHQAFPADPHQLTI